MRADVGRRHFGRADDRYVPGRRPKFTTHRHCPSRAPGAGYGIRTPRDDIGGTPVERFERAAGGGMSRTLLVSVVEDDQFCRDSMRRLMRSLGYTVEPFSSAAAFLASPRLS